MATKKRNVTKLQRRLIRQRDRLRARLGGLVRACVAARSADAYKDGKAAYSDEISKSCMAAIRVLEEDFPERPKFDFSSVPKIEKNAKYTCTQRWFCRQVVSCLLDYRIGDEKSAKRIAQYRGFLNRLKLIAIDAVEGGREWYDEENLEDEYVKLSSSKEEGCDPYTKHSFKWLVGEFCRYLREFQPGEMEGYSLELYKEVSSAMVQSCLIAVGVDIFDTESVFEFLSEKNKNKDLVVMRGI